MRYLALLLLACALGSGQVTNGVLAEPQTQSHQKDYRVGAADVLSIAVIDLPELSRTVTVSNSGKIHLPYLGILPVLDMTCPQIEAEIGRMLSEKQLVKEPWVQVSVREYRAQSVYILGEVMQGGQYVIRNEMYVTDLLTLGMGLNSVASPIVYLYRRAERSVKTDGDGGKETELVQAIPINLEDLYSGKTPELNFKLRGGDMLYCPERQREFFYVLGEVNRPGTVEILGRQEILASRALSQVGGPLRTARIGKGLLVRYNAAGEREDMAIDFQAILRGKKPDFAVKPNDVIFIPGSTAKTLGYGLLNTIPGMAETGVLLF